MRRGNQKGLTLVELIVAFTIMLVLTTMAVPLARSRVRAERERELRAALDEVRDAIDKYHDLNMVGYFGPVKEGTDWYPENLDMLVDGVKRNNAAGTKMKFLRRIPRDPFTGKFEWGLRSKAGPVTAATTRQASTAGLDHPLVGPSMRP